MNEYRLGYRERRTFLGHPFGVWEAIRMPRIDDRILDCSIYLYPSEDAARSGVDSGGSGVLVGMPADVPWKTLHVYAVTNSHVIAEAPVVRLNTKSGDSDTLPLEQRDWIHHPNGDDLAVCAISGILAMKYAMRVVPISMLLDHDTIAKYNIGPGDETFTIGRFITIDGGQRNMPTVRFGHIAMMPTPILQQQRNFQQDSFLVEAHSIAGFSGSPVFVCLQPHELRKERTQLEDYTRQEWLLGLDWGHINNDRQYDRVYDTAGVQEIGKVHANTGIMAVVPAWKLKQMLLAEGLSMQRKEAERIAKEKRAASGPAAEMDAALPAMTEDEFQKALKRVSKKITPRDEGKKET